MSILELSVVPHDHHSVHLWDTRVFVDLIIFFWIFSLSSDNGKAPWSNSLAGVNKLFTQFIVFSQQFLHTLNDDDLDSAEDVPLSRSYVGAIFTYNMTHMSTDCQRERERYTVVRSGSHLWWREYTEMWCWMRNMRVSEIRRKKEWTREQVQKKPWKEREGRSWQGWRREGERGSDSLGSMPC